jgi:hypothetical protein
MNMFERYGLKEVANVTFYDIATKKPVLFLDTLKVSTIEQTAESTDARGGWGNPALITWDYNKEVNVTLEDALFSAASLRTIMGAGIEVASKENSKIIDINENLSADADGKVVLSYAAEGTTAYYLSREAGEYVEAEIANNAIEVEGYKEGEAVQVFYKVKVADQGDLVEITIGAAQFGGTYKVVGDTIVRSEKTGKDEPFQFVIEKAKIQSEVTFTMEAEGDPATFNLPLRVLRDEHNQMFKLIKYNLPAFSA